MKIFSYRAIVNFSCEQNGSYFKIADIGINLFRLDNLIHDLFCVADYSREVDDAK